MIGGPLHEVLTLNQQRALHAATQVLADTLLDEIAESQEDDESTEEDADA